MLIVLSVRLKGGSQMDVETFATFSVATKVLDPGLCLYYDEYCECSCRFRPKNWAPLVLSVLNA